MVDEVPVSVILGEAEDLADLAAACQAGVAQDEDGNYSVPR